MEFLLVIGFFAAIFGFAWLRKKAVIGVNRAIHKKEHEQAARLLRPSELTAPPMAPADLVDEILAELQVFDTPVAMKHRAYATRVNPSTLRIAFGNKLFTGWALALMAFDMGEDGLRVRIEHLEATEVDGVVPGMRELGLVHDRVRSAVARLQQSVAGGTP